MDEVLLPTLFEALANLKAKTDDLVEELNSFEGEYSKDRDLINTQIEDLTVQMDRLIKEAVNALPKAKDGEDAEIDYKQIEDFIKAEVDLIPKAKDGDDATVDYEIIYNKVKELVSEIPKPKNGDDAVVNYERLENEIKRLVDEIPIPEDGKDASNEQVQTKVNQWLNTHEEELKGEDGLSIDEIYEKNGYIVITLSDGTIKELKLPKIEKHMTTVRGGADNFSYDLVDKVVTIPYNQQLIVHGEIDIQSTLIIDGRLILEL